MDDKPTRSRIAIACFAVFGLLGTGACVANPTPHPGGPDAFAGPGGDTAAVDEDAPVATSPHDPDGAPAPSDDLGWHFDGPHGLDAGPEGEQDGDDGGPTDDGVGGPPAPCERDDDGFFEGVTG